MAQRSKCVSLFDVSAEVFYQASLTNRKAEIQKLIVEAPPNGFEDGEFAGQSDITYADTMIVSCYFLLVMGLPLGLVCTFCVLLLFGSWLSMLIFVLVVACLALHPLPKMSHENNFHPLCVRIMRAMFRYFSYRHMFSGDVLEKTQTGAAWIGAAPPHGALPIANMLCWPSFNLYFRPFIGATADVVKYTPGLRSIFAAFSHETH